MPCWPSVVSFCTSLVNAVLRLCSCVLRQLSEIINFWHNSSRALDLRGLFLYSGPQVSHKHGCFSSPLQKSFLWASDICSLINSQSWVPAFSTSTTSAMFTSCPNRISPRSSARLLTIFPAFLVQENWPITSVVKCSKLWRKWWNWKFVAKSRTWICFAQHIATTCNIEICCLTSRVRGWWYRQQRFSTCAKSCAAMLPVLLDLKAVFS